MSVIVVANHVLTTTFEILIINYLNHMMKTLFTRLFLAFIISIPTASVKAQVDINDSLVLVDLYNSTNGPGWLHHKNWLRGPVSTWQGITLTDDNKSPKYSNYDLIVQVTSPAQSTSTATNSVTIS